MHTNEENHSVLMTYPEYVLTVVCMHMTYDIRHRQPGTIVQVLREIYDVYVYIYYVLPPK